MGYLSRLNRVVHGKVRKYYLLTRRGGLVLIEAREKIGELVGGGSRSHALKALRVTDYYE